MIPPCRGWWSYANDAVAADLLVDVPLVPKAAVYLLEAYIPRSGR